MCVGWPYIYGDRGAYCTPEHREAVYNKGPSKTCYQNVKKACAALNGWSCDGCKWKPGGYNVRAFDCRGFTYWVIFQIYGWKLMGAGATSQWNTESNWKAKGLVADGVPEDTLVCLFYTNSKNQKVMAHTGLGYRGETVECSAGVQHAKTRGKKWTHWAVPACVDGDVAPAPKPETRPTLRRGSKGEYVTECQTDLVTLGYDVGQSGIDGVYGKDTMAALRAFQADRGLNADGICGPKTWALLVTAAESVKPGTEPLPEQRVTYTVTISGIEKAEAERIAAGYPGKAAIRQDDTGSERG